MCCCFCDRRHALVVTMKMKAEMTHVLFAAMGYMNSVSFDCESSQRMQMQ